MHFLKKYHKIRWLSRWKAAITPCDSLDCILTYFRDNRNAMKDGIGYNLFKHFRIFKHVYVFFFDIFHVLPMLSHLILNKFMDITTICSVVHTDL